MKTRALIVLLLIITQAMWLAGCGNDSGQDQAAGGADTDPEMISTGGEAGEPAGHGDHGSWLDYEAGVAKARSEGKYMVIDFYTDWCHWCKVMDKDTFSKDEIKSRFADSFVTIRVDAESDKPQGSSPDAPSGKQLAASFGVRSYPTLWFLDSEGGKISPLPGFVDADRFGGILDFISTGSYKSMNYQEFQGASQAGE
jgi:thioredoxin-related protein